MFDKIKKMFAPKKKSKCYSCRLHKVCPYPNTDADFQGCTTWTPKYIDLRGFTLEGEK